MINLVGDELNWFLKPEGTLNIHWIPLLKKKNNQWKFNFWKGIGESIEINNKVDFLFLMRSEVAFYLGIPPLSPENAEFLKNGKIGN